MLKSHDYNPRLTEKIEVNGEITTDVNGNLSYHVVHLGAG